MDLQRQNKPGPKRSWLKVMTSLTVLVVLLAGCADAPSMFAPKGPAAARIANLGWFMTILGLLIWVGVVGFLMAGLFRRRRAEESEGEPDNGIRFVLFGGIAFPVVVLLILYGYTTATMAALAAPETAEDLVVEVRGYRWWWEVRYPNQQFTTANEIHIPVDVPVEIILTSQDVIHSFWVPELQGKMDLVPGDVNSLWIEADRPGVFYGECAEFCGIQHAKMQIIVVAEPMEQFEEWLERMQEPAPVPASPILREGQEVFLSSSCVYCHAIEGTNATGQLGPDLTHLASRRTLAAGTVPNTIGNLAGWITDPHSIKPGNLMPPTDLSGEELQALLAYLSSLE